MAKKRRSSRLKPVRAHTRGHRGAKPGPRQKVKSYRRKPPDPSSYPR